MAQADLKLTVSKVLDRIGLTEQNYSFMSVVEKNLPVIGKTAQLIGVKNKKIYIEVASSTEFQEARFKKRELLKSLVQAFPGPETSAFDVRFSLKGTAESAPKFIKVNPDAPRPPRQQTNSRASYRSKWRKITG